MQCRDKADVTAISHAYDEYRPMLELLWNVREKTVDELVMLYSVVKHAQSMKEFGIGVQHHPLRHILFQLRNGDITNVVDEVAKLKPIKLTRIAKNKWEKEYISASQQLNISASQQLKSLGGSDGDSKAGKEEDKNSWSVGPGI